MTDLVHAHIHEFFPHPVTGFIDHDEEGDPMLGFYFQLVDGDGLPVMGLMGPYKTAEDAEEACHREWMAGDY